MNKKYNFLLKYMSPYKGVFINIFVTAIFVTMIGMNWPYIYKIIIDDIFYKKSMDVFVFIVILYLVIFIVEKLLQLLWRLADACIATEFLTDIRKDLYIKAFNFKATIKDESSAGVYIDIINNDVDQIFPYVTEHTIHAIISALRLVLTVFYTCYINLTIGIAIAIMIPLNYFFSSFIKKRFKKYLLEYRKSQQEYQSWIMDILNGLKEIKYLSSAYYVKTKFFEKLRKLVLLETKQTIETAHGNNGLMVLNFLSDIVIYSLSAYLITRGKMTVGGLISVMLYYEWGKAFFVRMSAFLINREKNSVAIDRILDFLGKEEETSGEGEFLNGDIRLENVYFSYGENSVLQGINMNIEQGKSIAITGASGSGKSTIANLILNFYQPQQGNITIAGRDLNSIANQEIRKSVGIVRQEPYLFKASIRSNLALAKEDATDEELWEALRVAMADQFVRNLPNQLDEVILPENNLSSGEIQRITLARIILKNPAVIIFDEATANLDSDTEKAFLNNLYKIKGKKTLIIITYRTNSLEDTDWVYFIKKGKIFGQGKHKELCEHCSEYRELSQIPI